MNEVKVKVRVDRYERDQKDIIFVNGYALVERDINVAYKLARDLGQDHIKVTFYPIKGRPDTLNYTV